MVLEKRTSRTGYQKGITNDIDGFGRHGKVLKQREFQKTVKGKIRGVCLGGSKEGGGYPVFSEM